MSLHSVLLPYRPAVTGNRTHYRNDLTPVYGDSRHSAVSSVTNIVTFPAPVRPTPARTHSPWSAVALTLAAVACVVIGALLIVLAFA